MPWDSTWEKIFQSQNWGKYPSEPLIRFIAKNFYNKDRKKVNLMEIGFGTGANIWYMANEGFNVFGVEGSKTATDICRRILEEKGLEAQLHTEDFRDFSIREKMDAIVDVECLCTNSYNDAHKILENIYKHLKPGGLFFSQTFSDKMYIGKSRTIISNNQYKDISDGPLAGTGFVRLVSESDIYTLYGKNFQILSLDKIEHTRNNREYLVSLSFSYHFLNSDGRKVT